MAGEARTPRGAWLTPGDGGIPYAYRLSNGAVVIPTYAVAGPMKFIPSYSPADERSARILLRQGYTTEDKIELLRATVGQSQMPGVRMNVGEHDAAQKAPAVIDHLLDFPSQATRTDSALRALSRFVRNRTPLRTPEPEVVKSREGEALAHFSVHTENRMVV